MNGRGQDHEIKSLLEDSNRLLEEMDRSRDFVNGAGRSVAVDVAEEIRRNTMASIGEFEGAIVDGDAVVTVSEDEMEVIADFYPPSPGMEPYRPDQFLELLRRRRVTTGVDMPTITDTIFRCNTDCEPISGVVVARGQPVHNQTPPHFEIEAQVFENIDSDDDVQQRVDHRDRSPFTMARRGQTLARLVPVSKGTIGCNVRGVALPYRTNPIHQLTPGKNVVCEEDLALAACDGRFESDGTTFCINEVLEIANDVDYSTGNIEFAGDVIIRGDVREGFEVRADGAVSCGGTVEASQINCGGNLTIRHGVIGKGKGVVKAGGRFAARFVENCYIEATGPMRVVVGLMNSAVHTLDRVDLAHKGVIVGGVLYAQNGVTATQLGSQSGIKTEIHCGTDFVVEQKLRWIRERNLELATKLVRVNQKVKRSAPPQPALIDLRDKLRAAIHQMNEAAMNAVSSLDRNDDAQIVVRGRVYPDVYIEICHCSYVVTRMANAVRFRLEKSTGSVLMERLR